MSKKKQARETVVYTDEHGRTFSAKNMSATWGRSSLGTRATNVENGYDYYYVLNGFATCKVTGKVSFWYVFEGKEPH